MLRIHETILQLVRDVAPLAVAIGRHDADLARQFRRAMSSVPLNVSEASAQRGARRNSHYSIALGSAREALSALRTAAAWGYVPEPSAELSDRFDKVMATLYVNAHGDSRGRWESPPVARARTRTGCPARQTLGAAGTAGFARPPATGGTSSSVSPASSAEAWLFARLDTNPSSLSSARCVTAIRAICSTPAEVSRKRDYVDCVARGPCRSRSVWISYSPRRSARS